MSDEWLVEVLGEIAAYADQRSLDWLLPLMDAAHVTARRELILKGSVSLKGFQATTQGQTHARTDDPQEAESAQVLDFEQFRLQRGKLAQLATGDVGFSAN